jgi:hypothetical protein
VFPTAARSVLLFKNLYQPGNSVMLDIVDKLHKPALNAPLHYRGGYNNSQRGGKYERCQYSAGNSVLHHYSPHDHENGIYSRNAATNAKKIETLFKKVASPFG